MKTFKQYNDELGFPYIAYIADDVDDNPALIIQLHGAGERGSGGEDLDRVSVHGFANILPCDNFKNCILIMPQCPVDSFWVAKIESLKIFIDNIIKLYNADKSRVYLTGLSMGGYGTWYTAMAYPDLFAAIAPCCGGGMPWNASVLKMPIRAFHGTLDSVVLPSNSIDMFEALKDVNDDISLELFEGVEHNSWVMAYTHELLKWLLEQRK